MSKYHYRIYKTKDITQREASLTKYRLGFSTMYNSKDHDEKQKTERRTSVKQDKGEIFSTWKLASVKCCSVGWLIP